MKRVPGRPRDAAVTANIVATALNLSMHRGVDGFTMEDVSRRSGVAKSTIYRRWSSKTDLLGEAVLSVMERDIPIPDSGSVERDLVSLLVDEARFFQTAIGHVVLQLAAGSLTNQSLAVVIEPMRAQSRRRYRAVLARGVAAGQLAPDLDLQRAVDLLSSVVWMRVLTHQRLDRRLIAGVVSWALQGIGRVPADTADSGDAPPASGPTDRQRRPSTPRRQ